MLGGLGLFVLGAGSSYIPASPVNTIASFGPAQAVFGLLILGVHWLWLGRAPKTEYEPVLRRAYYVVGAVAFLAGLALFGPFALAHALAGQAGLAESIIAALSLGCVVFFAWRLNRELSA